MSEVMRKVKYRNAEYVENHSAMNLHHAGKSLATGRKVRGLWLLTAKGFCWIDPDARKPNAIGVVEPRLMVKKGKATARHELQQIALLL